MRHEAVRVWWRPWRKRCACGCRWFPCPDSVTLDRPGYDTTVLRRNHPWNSPTTRLPHVRNERPLMTPGQEWRTRQPRR